MLKVLHILTDTNVGGAGTYVANYINNCDKTVVTPTLLVPKGSSVVKLVKDCEIIEADIAADKSLDIPSVKVIRKYIKQGKYDLVHAHGSASARIAAKGICKSVFTKHTLSVGGSALSKFVYGFLGGYAIAVSNAAKNNLVELGFDDKKIYTVFNGVSDMTLPTADAKSTAKQSFGIDPSKYVVGCVSRFSEEKGYDTLVNAAKFISDKIENVTFLFVGDGNTQQSMIDLAKSLGIYHNCIFAGRLYDIQRAYHAMDTFCLTSNYESFGQSLVEAWSAGVPSVVTDASGTKEISEDGVTAIVCERKNSKQVADAVQIIHDDTILSATLSQNGRKQYLSKYTATTFAKNIEKVYLDIIK